MMLRDSDDGIIRTVAMCVRETLLSLAAKKDHKRKLMAVKLIYDV